MPRSDSHIDRGHIDLQDGLESLRHICAAMWHIERMPAHLRDNDSRIYVDALGSLAVVAEASCEGLIKLSSEVWKQTKK